MIRYILSNDRYLQEAVKAVDNGDQTLLHLVCTLTKEDCVGVREQLVELLLEKGVDPAAVDSKSKQAVDLLSPPGSPLWKLLKKATGISKREFLSSVEILG